MTVSFEIESLTPWLLGGGLVRIEELGQKHIAPGVGVTVQAPASAVAEGEK